MKNNNNIAIVGGGLAGLSAGVYLSPSDNSVTLLESEPHLGGRTSCWLEEGMKIESGFHRYLGFYEELPLMLEKVGIDLDEMLVWTDKIKIWLPDAEARATFGLSLLHEPLNTIGGAFGNNDFLPLDQKAAVGKFFAKGFFDLEKNPKQLDEYTVLDYARNLDLSTDTINKVLVPLTEGLFFLGIEKYSAYHLFALFEPYLTKLHKSRVGAYSGCMSSVMIQPLENFLVKNGVTLNKGTSVEEMNYVEKEGWRLKTKKSIVYADKVVLATPVSATQNLLSKYAADYSKISKLMQLKSMPTVCIQIELKEPSLDTDTVVFSPTTILASYTEQSRTTFPDSKGRFSAILSNPQKLLEMNDDAIIDRVVADANILGINLPKKNIIEYRVNRWIDDFYSYERNMYDKRPDTNVGLPDLFLAGDYTNQKYLQTMEGAVYSGRLAAEEVLVN